MRHYRLTLIATLLLTSSGFSPAAKAREIMPDPEGLKDHNPNAAVESAARRFRIHLYETYRLNRPEYDRRIEMALKVETLAKEHAPADYREQLVEWFDTALLVSTHETDQPLPTMPEPWIEALDEVAPEGIEGPELTSAPVVETPSSAAPYEMTLTPPAETSVERMSSSPDEASDGGVVGALGRALMGALNSAATEPDSPSP